MGTSLSEVRNPYDKEWLDQLGGMPSRKVTQEILKRYDLTLDAQQITSDKIANFGAIAHKGDVIPETYALLQQQYQLKKIGIGTRSGKTCESDSKDDRHPFNDTYDCLLRMT